MTKLRIRLKGLVDSISDDDWIRDLLDKAKDKGFVSLKGKDYEVKDGEVIEFKFSG